MTVNKKKAQSAYAKGSTAKKTVMKTVGSKQCSQKAANGVRLTKGSGYKIAATKGKEREFNGTLLGTMNRGKTRLAIFSVSK